MKKYIHVLHRSFGLVLMFFDKSYYYFYLDTMDTCSYASKTMPYQILAPLQENRGSQNALGMWSRSLCYQYCKSINLYITKCSGKLTLLTWTQTIGRGFVLACIYICINVRLCWHPYWHAEETHCMHAIHHVYIPIMKPIKIWHFERVLYRLCCNVSAFYSLHMLR